MVLTPQTAFGIHHAIGPNKSTTYGAIIVPKLLKNDVSPIAWILQLVGNISIICNDMIEYKQIMHKRLNTPK